MNLDVFKIITPQKSSHVIWLLLAIRSIYQHLISSEWEVVILLFLQSLVIPPVITLYPVIFLPNWRHVSSQAVTGRNWPDLSPESLFIQIYPVFQSTWIKKCHKTWRYLSLYLYLHNILNIQDTRRYVEAPFERWVTSGVHFFCINITEVFPPTIR